MDRMVTEYQCRVVDPIPDTARFVGSPVRAPGLISDLNLTQGSVRTEACLPSRWMTMLHNSSSGVALRDQPSMTCHEYTEREVAAQPALSQCLFAVRHRPNTSGTPYDLRQRGNQPFSLFCSLFQIEFRRRITGNVEKRVQASFFCGAHGFNFWRISDVGICIV